MWWGLLHHNKLSEDVHPSNRFLCIILRTDGRNSLKFGMLMYVDHPQNCLNFGHGLLLGFSNLMHNFDCVKQQSPSQKSLPPLAVGWPLTQPNHPFSLGRKCCVLTLVNIIPKFLKKKMQVSLRLYTTIENPSYFFMTLSCTEAIQSFISHFNQYSLVDPSWGNIPSWVWHGVSHWFRKLRRRVWHHRHFGNWISWK